MQSIDLDSLEEAEENYEAVAFDIILSGPPQEKWIEEFDIAYRTMPFDIKPPAEVIGDRLRVEYMPRYGDELQEYIDYLKLVLERVEEEVDKSESILLHDDRPHVIPQFRETLKRVHL
jgi:hypothetical protein